MKIYFLVFLLTLLAQFIPVKDSKQYWWRTVCSFIPLFLFMALRRDYGVDESGYHYFFDCVHKVSWQKIYMVNDHMESGYAVLNKIMPSYQSLIVLISFINCWALSFLIYRFVPYSYSWLAILLLFMTSPTTIFFMISGIRNGLAASLLILSTYYLVGQKRRIVPFVIVGIIATSVHTSALAMFAVTFLLSYRPSISSREMRLWIVAMILASFASLSSLANTLMPIIEMFTGRYVEQVEEMAEIADERGFMGALAGIVLATGILIFLKGNGGSIAKDYFAKYKWALFYCFSFTLGMLGGRMGQYMIYYFIVASTCLFAYWNKPVFKYGYLIIVLYFFRLTFMDWISNPLFKYWTYTSVLGDF